MGMMLFVRMCPSLSVFSFLLHLCSASQELKTDDTDEKILQDHQKQSASSIVISKDMEQYFKILKNSSFEQANAHIRSKSAKLSEETRQIGHENYIGLLQKHVRKTSWELEVRKNKFLLDSLNVTEDECPDLQEKLFNPSTSEEERESIRTQFMKYQSERERKKRREARQNSIASSTSISSLSSTDTLSSSLLLNQNDDPAVHRIRQNFAQTRKELFPQQSLDNNNGSIENQLTLIQSINSTDDFIDPSSQNIHTRQSTADDMKNNVKEEEEEKKYDVNNNMHHKMEEEHRLRKTKSVDALAVSLAEAQVNSENLKKKNKLLKEEIKHLKQQLANGQKKKVHWNILPNFMKSKSSNNDNNNNNDENEEQEEE